MTLNAFCWLQIFALDTAIVEVQELFSSHGSFLTIAMYQYPYYSVIIICFVFLKYHYDF